MVKSRFFGFFILLILAAFIGCSSSSSSSSSSSGTKAIALGATLTLSGEITHTFTPFDSWAEDFVHIDATSYKLVSTTGGIDDGTFIDEDNSNDANINFSTAGPDINNTVTAGDWGFSSSPSDVKLYSAEAKKEGAGEVYEGNFDFVTNGVVRYYLYVYVSKDCTLSGTTTGGGESYTFNNVILSQGWNAIISETSDGSTFNYRGGTISNTKWTLITPGE